MILKTSNPEPPHHLAKLNLPCTSPIQSPKHPESLTTSLYNTAVSLTCSTLSSPTYPIPQLLSHKTSDQILFGAVDAIHVLPYILGQIDASGAFYQIVWLISLA
ncbi:hypothetical protein Drorol1_Dr00004125 [Drosera rotundifolia]